MPLLRWPGGNFVSGYHWIDGVGPRDERPRKSELAWLAEESNRFGTDEFIEYCRVLDTDPYICINMGTGTIDEAQAWVEYCNGTGNTHWANLRRKNGHEEPFNVRYWGLGNELYGGWQLGASTADDYVKKGREFAKVMKLTDPSIELISCGQNGWSDWDRVVIEGLAAIVDYHSIHIYTGSGDYYRNVFQPHQAERAIRICAAMIEQARYNQRISRPIGIAYDEWNVWYRTRSAADRQAGIEEQYDLSDALAIATYLNIFIRQCKDVPIANLAQMVNAIAPIFTNPDGLFLQTIYHPLRLYAEHAQAIALDPAVICETYALESDSTAGRARAPDRRSRAVPAARRQRHPRRGRQDRDPRHRQSPPRRRRHHHHRDRRRRADRRRRRLRSERRRIRPSATRSTARTRSPSRSAPSTADGREPGADAAGPLGDRRPPELYLSRPLPWRGRRWNLTTEH